MKTTVKIDLLERAQTEIEAARRNLAEAEALGIDPQVNGVIEDLTRLVIRVTEAVQRLRSGDPLQDEYEVESPSK